MIFNIFPWLLRFFSNIMSNSNFCFYLLYFGVSNTQNKKHILKIYFKNWVDKNYNSNIQYYPIYFKRIGRYINIFREIQNDQNYLTMNNILI
jgi:hypothetical protein